MTQRNFLDQLYKLAAQVAEKAQQEDTEFGQKVEALKALTPYYAAIMKGKKGGEDEPSEPGGNFGSWRDQVRVVDGGADGGTEAGISVGGRRGRTAGATGE